MGTMQATLRNILGSVDQVLDAVHSLSSASSQVATGSSQQSEATYLRDGSES